MGKHVGFLYRVEWSNPYTSPPNEAPRVKVEYFETIQQRKERMAGGGHPVPDGLSSCHKLGDGYCISIQAVCKPSVQLSEEKLAAIRLKRLERRVRGKYPLFADEFIAQEMARKHAYYTGETRSDLQAAHTQAIQKEQELYTRFLEATQNS